MKSLLKLIVAVTYYYATNPAILFCESLSALLEQNGHYRITQVGWNAYHQVDLKRIRISLAFTQYIE